MVVFHFYLDREDPLEPFIKSGWIVIISFSFQQHPIL